MADGGVISVITTGGEQVCSVHQSGVKNGLDLKNCIAASEGTPAEQQRLLAGGDVIADDEPVSGVGKEETITVTLIRGPPAKLVYIQGGQGKHVAVDAAGIIKPGPRFPWRMMRVIESEFTFQAAEGPHEGKYISALRGEAYSSGTQLQLTGFADVWAVDTKDRDTFYDWNRCGPFAMGIRESTKTFDNGNHAYWRWQSSHYHLAGKTLGGFQGDEAYFIAFADDDTPAVERKPADEE